MRLISLDVTKTISMAQTGHVTYNLFRRILQQWQTQTGKQSD